MVRDLITSWANGASGSFDYEGTSYNYSIQTDDLNSTDDDARFAKNDYTLLTLDQPISGFTISVTDLDEPFGEVLQFELDGVVLDLNAALASGAVSITYADGSPIAGGAGNAVNANGDLSGVSGTDADYALTFNVPFTTLKMTQIAGSGYTLVNDAVPCFSQGTLISTESGDKYIEDLRVGDILSTKDAGNQAIRWIGSRKITSYALKENPKLRPVRIKAGALGSNLPIEDLIVSRQHRVLVRSNIAERMFGTNEVLIPAIKLIGLEGIEIADDLQEVEYFHILFDQHQIIYSNGAPTESLFTGPEALKALSPEARAEITTLFPEIAKPGFNPHPAALIPRKTKKVKHFVERHSKNRKPLLVSI